MIAPRRFAAPGGGVAGHAIAVAVLCLAVLLVYARSIGFDYVEMDDTEYVLLTAPVMDGLSLDGVLWALTSTRFNNWHPLTWMSYMLDVSLFGPGPAGQHLVNMLLHALNTVLFYGLAYTILGQRTVAFVVAALFGVHALHVESVAWIAERKDVLCGLFYLLAMQLHLRYVAAPGCARYLALQLAGALALMSKPMAVTLPFALLLLDAWPLGRVDPPGSARALPGWLVSPGVRRLVVEKIPLFAMVAGACVITLVAQQSAMAPAEDVSAGYRLQNAVIALATYVRQLLLPTQLAALYQLYPIVTWKLVAASAVVLSLTVIALRTRRERPWLLFGWLFFLGTLVPVIGLVQVGSQAHADRYMYIPSVGLLLAAGGELARLGAGWMRRWRIAVAAVLVLHGFLAWIQVGYWANPYMLYSRLLDVDPRAYQSHVGLSAYYLGIGQLELAERHGLAALAMNPTSHFVYAGMGNIYLERGKPVEAERMYRQAIERLPVYPTAINNLGLALERQGRIDEARACFATAAAMDPALRGVAGNLERVGG